MTQTEEILLDAARYGEQVAARERMEAARRARERKKFEGLDEPAKPKKYSEYEEREICESLEKQYAREAKRFRIAKEHIDDAIYAAINKTSDYNISEEDIANAFIFNGSVLETCHCKYPVELFSTIDYNCRTKWIIKPVSTYYENRKIAWDDVDIVEAFWNTQCRKAFDGGFRTGVFYDSGIHFYRFFTLIKGKYTDYYYMRSVAEALRKPLNEEKGQAYTLTRKPEKK